MASTLQKALGPLNIRKSIDVQQPQEKEEDQQQGLSLAMQVPMLWRLHTHHCDSSAVGFSPECFWVSHRKQWAAHGHISCKNSPTTISGLGCLIQVHFQYYSNEKCKV